MTKLIFLLPLKHLTPLLTKPKIILMKYKNINSMLHNFGHSFCSLMNYVDGEYIIDILPEVLKKTKEGYLEIQFPGGAIEPTIKIPDKLKRSIGHAGDWLPRHIEGHKLDPDKISNIRMTIQKPSPSNWKSAIFGLICDVYCTDDRGKDHKVWVNQHGKL